MVPLNLASHIVSRVSWSPFELATNLQLLGGAILWAFLYMTGNIVRCISSITLKSSLWHYLVIRQNCLFCPNWFSFILKVIMIYCRAIKLSIPYFQLPNRFKLWIFTNFTSNIIGIICAITLESSFRHNLIFRERGSLASLAYTFIIIILPIAWCTLEIST